MSADYRIKEIRKIIKEICSNHRATYDDLAAALDAIKTEVDIYEYRKKKEMKE